MIAAIIVLGSITFAAVFVLAYCFHPGLRQQIERPKYVFQEQLLKYNHRCNESDLDKSDQRSET